MRKPTEPDDSGEKRSRTARQFALTTSWDDGYPLDLRVAELLVKYGLQGTFYIPSETGHPILRDEQVSELAKAFEVGAHTLHHVDLTPCRTPRRKTKLLRRSTTSKKSPKRNAAPFVSRGGDLRGGTSPW